MRKVAQEIMEENFNKISKYEFDRMVVLNAESYYGFKVEYPKYGYKFNKNMMHYVEFLSNYVEELKVKKPNNRVKYFDPCKFSRYLKIFNEPREILSKVFNINNFNFSKNKSESYCCGGYISFFDKDYANRISMEIIEECIESNSDTLVTACPLCLDN